MGVKILNMMYRYYFYLKSQNVPGVQNGMLVLILHPLKHFIILNSVVNHPSSESDNTSDRGVHGGMRCSSSPILSRHCYGARWFIGRRRHFKMGVRF